VQSEVLPVSDARRVRESLATLTVFAIDVFVCPRRGGRQRLVGVHPGGEHSRACSSGRGSGARHRRRSRRGRRRARRSDRTGPSVAPLAKGRTSAARSIRRRTASKIRVYAFLGRCGGVDRCVRQGQPSALETRLAPRTAARDGGTCCDCCWRDRTDDPVTTRAKNEPWTWTSNFTLERTAGSHSLAAAAQRERSTTCDAPRR